MLQEIADTYWLVLEHPFPADRFPKPLISRPGARSQPPEFVLGWVINTDDFIERAEDYGVLKVYPRLTPDNKVFESPNVVASINALGWAIQEELGIKLPVEFFFILGQRSNGEWVHMVHVCTNYNLSRKPSDEVIAKIQGKLGLEEPPRWYPHKWGRNWDC